MCPNAEILSTPCSGACLTDVVTSCSIATGDWGPWHGCSDNVEAVSQIPHQAGLGQLGVGTHNFFSSQSESVLCCLVAPVLFSPLILGNYKPLHYGKVVFFDSLNNWIIKLYKRVLFCEHVLTIYWKNQVFIIMPNKQDGSLTSISLLQQIISKA